MRRRTLAFLPLAALLLALPALRVPGATADDPAPRTGGGARAGDDPFEWRIFPVAAITSGRTAFGLERGETPVPADLVNDDEEPVFGSEGEERWKLYGSIDDVIELVKAHEPIAFDREGVSIGAQGTIGIIVRAPRATQLLVARYLAGLEREALRTVTIDVLVVRGDARAADEGGFDAARARGDLVAVGGARGSCGVCGKASARVGFERAYVQDQDVEVAQESYIADPIVAVLKGGLFWRAEVAEVVADRVATSFEGWWAEPGEPDPVTLPTSGELVERVTATTHRAVGLFDLPIGRWELVESAGDVSFALRATVREYDGTAPEPPVFGGYFPADADGPLTSRTIDIGDLVARVEMRRGAERRLAVSYYTPPEPPELVEPYPRANPDELLERLRLLDPVLAERGDIELVRRAGGRFLDVSAPARHVEAIERFVAEERRRMPRTVRLRGTVVALPLASIPEYLAGLDDGATLVADGGASLLARAGAAVVDRASVRIPASGRFTSDGGRSHSYVCDYDVEIALGAQIGNPIVREVREGMRFDVDSSLAAEPGALYAEFRIDRATWRGSRDVPTPNGDLECPTLGISRIRGGACVRAGSPRIVGATLENGVVTLTIVGASLE